MTLLACATRSCTRTVHVHVHACFHSQHTVLLVVCMYMYVTCLACTPAWINLNTRTCKYVLGLRVPTGSFQNHTFSKKTNYMVLPQTYYIFATFTKQTLKSHTHVHVHAHLYMLIYLHCSWGGLELLKRTFLKATMIVIIIRLYFFIFRVLTKYTGQDASKATSIKNKSNSWPLGFGVTPTEKPHLPRSHSRGSKFSGHPDLRWGAIPLSAKGKKK